MQCIASTQLSGGILFFQGFACFPLKLQLISNMPREAAAGTPRSFSLGRDLVANLLA